LLNVTVTPEIGALVSDEVIVPVTVPHKPAAEAQDGNLKVAIRVDQLKPPFVFKYSFV
jgi:hypothetical protein